MFQSHDGPDDEMKAARRILLDRYTKPIYRYLLASVKDRHAADELYQEFALRFVRGEFRRAHPDRGRFRHYLKRTLHHLVADHFRKQRRQPTSLDESEMLPDADNTPNAEIDREFTDACRSQLLTRTWEALRKYEEDSGKPLHTVLHRLTTSPQLSSQQLAEQLNEVLKQEVNAGWIRKRVHYARTRFAELLLQEVIATLENPNRDQLQEELQDLGLLEYCRTAMENYRSA